MAFPSTPIIDDFTGADANPIGTPWLGALFLSSAEDQLQRLSNQGAGVAAAAFSSSYTISCGPDCEAYMTVPTVDAGNRIEVYARVVDIHPVNGTDAYCVSQSAGNWTLRLISNSGSSAIGGTVVQAFASGDSIGIKITGSTLEAWYKSGAGAWTQLFTRTDTTWSGAGFLGARMFGTTYRVDNFGGGTFVPEATAFPTFIRRSRQTSW